MAKELEYKIQKQQELIDLQSKVIDAMFLELGKNRSMDDIAKLPFVDDIKEIALLKMEAG